MTVAPASVLGGPVWQEWSAKSTFPEILSRAARASGVAESTTKMAATNREVRGRNPAMRLEMESFPAVQRLYPHRRRHPNFVRRAAAAGRLA